MASKDFRPNFGSAETIGCSGKCFLLWEVQWPETG